METLATVPGKEHELDPGGFDEIDESECWRLMATQPVGRVAVIVGHYAQVFPVNFAVVDRSVAFRTNAGTKLWATTRSNITFQVDQLDTVHKAGWSVMMRGVARELSFDRHPALARSAENAAPDPWAPGPRDHLVRITADSISGRRIRPAELPPVTEIRGYL